MPWLELLPVDPLPTLLEWDDPALHYLVRRDLLGEAVPAIDTLWEGAEPARLVKKQQADGSWK